MENFNLKTFEKTIATTKLKQSLKIAIRDVDETSKNNFVAYADDKNESFDVSIEIDDEKNILDSNCDCEVKGLCNHRIAFMLHLNTISGKPKTVRAKKLTATEQLVNSLDANALRIWVSALLKKNKDLEFLFTNEFSIIIEEYNKPKVKSIIDNSIKSVIKTRKNIEANELKKVLDLLEITLKPVIEFCQNDLLDKEKLEIIFFIFDELIDFEARIYTNSVKIARFIEKISNQVIDSISVTNDEIKFQKITDLHFELVFNENTKYLRIQSFLHLKRLYTSNADNETRKKYYSDKIKNFILNRDKNKNRFGVTVDTFLLEVLFDNNLFEETSQFFEPVRYENEYNLSLINKLLAINKVDYAEKIALAQVASNYYIEYNLPYWKILKQIYSDNNNPEKLIAILVNTVPVDNNYDDFLMIKKHLPEVEFKKFRSNLLGRTKRNFSSDPFAPDFYFKILAEEDNYKKMLESISEYTDYDLLFEHRQGLKGTDIFAFLLAISAVEGRYSFRNQSFNEEYKEKLADWIIEVSEKPKLKTFVNSRSNQMNSSFIDMIVGKLK